MALQIRRGTAADVSSESFVPLIGEPLYLTDNQKLYIGDGSTQGGNAIGGATDVDELTSVTLSSEAVGALNLYEVTNNIVKVTLSVGQSSYFVGLEVVISNSSVAALNGTHTILSIPTGSQFTFALTTANVASTSITGTVTPKIPDGRVLTWDNTNSYWKDAETSVDNDTQFTKFQFNLAAAPTGSVSSSQLLGQQPAIGTFSEVTFANTATNGVGPTSAIFNPTLTGVTQTAGAFTGFAAGIYRIDASLKITINGLAINSYLNYNQSIECRTGSTLLPGITQDFNFTTTGSAPSSVVNQQVNMSLVVHLENATAASNDVRFQLNGDQSQNYYCSGGTVIFTRIA